MAEVKIFQENSIDGLEISVNHYLKNNIHKIKLIQFIPDEQKTTYFCFIVFE